MLDVSTCFAKQKTMNELTVKNNRRNCLWMKLTIKLSRPSKVNLSFNLNVKTFAYLKFFTIVPSVEFQFVREVSHSKTAQLANRVTTSKSNLFSTMQRPAQRTASMDKPGVANLLANFSPSLRFLRAKSSKKTYPLGDRNAGSIHLGGWDFMFSFFRLNNNEKKMR